MTQDGSLRYFQIQYPNHCYRHPIQRPFCYLFLVCYGLFVIWYFRICVFHVRVLFFRFPMTSSIGEAQVSIQTCNRQKERRRPNQHRLERSTRALLPHTYAWLPTSRIATLKFRWVIITSTSPDCSLPRLYEPVAWLASITSA